MRTTVEISDEHCSRLMKLAAERGESGISRRVQEAIEVYLRAQDQRATQVPRALAALGQLDEAGGQVMTLAARNLRRTWR